MACVQVYTGDGKGKTTAAVGQAVRALGHGFRVCFIQFLKAPERPSGELEPLRGLGATVLRFAGQRPTFEVHTPEEEDALRSSSAEALSAARDAVLGGAYDLVVLDELNVAVALGLVDEGEVVDMLRRRPEAVEVVVTGRGASDAVLECADLVTRMESVRHPYEAGEVDRRGIDW